MDGRQQQIRERAADEGGLYEAEQQAEPPRREARRREDRRVEKGEHEPAREVREVADHACRAPVLGRDRAEQERDVHPRPPELLREPDAARDDRRADRAAGERTPEHGHVDGSSIATAALINARCVRPCGKLPRNAFECGSISSE